MKTSAPLVHSLRALALSGGLLLADMGIAHADWGVSINVPLQSEYSTYGSTTVYGAPGSQIISSRQVPQTVCQDVWVNGQTRQQCTTQFVTVPDSYGYVAPAPIYVAPAPVYVPAPTFGYPGYGYGYNYNNRRDWGRDDHRPRPHPHRAGPPPRTIETGPPMYGIGSSPPYGGSVNIRLNGR